MNLSILYIFLYAIFVSLYTILAMSTREQMLGKYKTEVNNNETDKSSF